MWKILLSDISFSNEEKNALLEVLNSKWITMGPKTQLFEEKWEKIYKSYSLAFSSCTAALFTALACINIKENDEVILPSLTFVADANVVTHFKAKPVFAEINSLDYPVITLDTIKKVVSPRTKCIIVVHYAGYPAPIDEIANFCSEKGIFLIEDCAHSPLVKYKDKYLGTYGDFGCFSFFGNKNITTAEGGMLITKEEEFYKKAKLLRSHGMTKTSWDKKSGHCFDYDVTIPGYNFRIDDLRSAVGIIQLSKLPQINESRKKLVHFYWENLKDIEEIILPFYNKKLPSAYHIMPIVLASSNQRNNVAHALIDNKIQVSLHYPPIHLFTAYYPLGYHLPKTEKYYMRELTLPLYPDLSFDNVKKICSIIKNNL